MVTLVAVTGATLREWLERSAGIFRQIAPGVADQPLIDAGFPSYNFDVIDGVTYAIDPTRPSRYDGDGKLVAPDAHRIVDLRYGGKPIDEAATFVVVGNNYRAGGGGNFPGVDAKAVILAAPDTNRDVIVRFIHQRGTVDPEADGNWRLASVPDTSVTFEAGPGAPRPPGRREGHQDRGGRPGRERFRALPHRVVIPTPRSSTVGKRERAPPLEPVRLTLKQRFNVSRWTASHVSSWRVSATA